MTTVATSSRGSGGSSAADDELDGPPPGIDADHPVTILREDALAVVASQVPVEEFDETRLREHLADIAWVEATSGAHRARANAFTDVARVGGRTRFVDAGAGDPHGAAHVERKRIERAQAGEAAARIPGTIGAAW
jgi:hypothetical protein